MNAPIVQVHSLVKVFPGGVRALDGLTLAVQPGIIYGLLGPNGAGKTTLIRVLATLLQPDEGSALIAGFDVRREPDEVRKRIGLAGQYAAVDDFRSLPMARSAVLAGRTISDLVRTAFIMALLLAVGYAIGFRPQTGLAGVLGALAVALAFAYAWSWVMVVVGLLVRSSEAVQVVG